jgi:hypothetical protein
MRTNYNLDFEAARLAREIINQTKKDDVKTVENLATKTLGILEENGVYACILFLFSRSNTKEKAVIEVIRNRLFDWNNLIFPEDKSNGIDLNKANTALDFVANNICNNLDTLNLVKKMWEQTLIYARYGAKAREE